MKNQNLVIVNKKDPDLRLEQLVHKRCNEFSFNKFSFSEKEKVKNFYSEICSLSEKNHANVALIDEQDENSIKANFYSVPKISAYNPFRLFKGKFILDCTHNNYLLARSWKFK